MSTRTQCICRFYRCRRTSRSDVSVFCVRSRGFGLVYRLVQKPFHGEFHELGIEHRVCRNRDTKNVNTRFRLGFKQSPTVDIRIDRFSLKTLVRVSLCTKIDGPPFRKRRGASRRWIREEASSITCKVSFYKKKKISN